MGENDVREALCRVTTLVVCNVHHQPIINTIIDIITCLVEENILSITTLKRTIL